MQEEIQDALESIAWLKVVKIGCRAVSVDKLSYVLERSPIMTVACYCNSCQQASEYLQKLDGAPVMAEDDGSTHFIMHRKDRLHCERGEEHLREYRLTAKSTTRRVVASCCNTPMFLEMANGHWLSVYRQTIDQKDQPPIELRTMTADRRLNVEFNDNIPSPKKHTIDFMWKLMSAWIAMGFRAPEINYVRGSLNG